MDLEVLAKYLKMAAAAVAKTQTTNSDLNLKQEVENSISKLAFHSSFEGFEKSNVLIGQTSQENSHETIYFQSNDLNEESFERDPVQVEVGKEKDSDFTFESSKNADSFQSSNSNVESRSFDQETSVFIKAEIDLTFQSAKNADSLRPSFQSRLFKTESELTQIDPLLNQIDPVQNQIALDVDRFLRSDLSNEQIRNGNFSIGTEERNNLSNLNDRINDNSKGKIKDISKDGRGKDISNRQIKDTSKGGQKDRNKSESLNNLKRKKLIGPKSKTSNLICKVILTQNDLTRKAVRKANKPKIKRVNKKTNGPIKIKKITERRSINKVQRTTTEKKYKCPECKFGFNHVSSVFTHSAVKHYSSELSKLHRDQFMLSDDKFCLKCPDRNLSEVSRYVLHVGGKHKMIQQFFPQHLIGQYDLLPIKKMNSAYNHSKHDKDLKCLICLSDRYFRNVTEYKQHLALTHFRKKISSSEFVQSNPELWKKKICVICAGNDKAAPKPFGNPCGLIMHFVSFVLSLFENYIKRILLVVEPWVRS